MRNKNYHMAVCKGVKQLHQALLHGINPLINISLEHSFRTNNQRSFKEIFIVPAFYASMKCSPIIPRNE